MDIAERIICERKRLGLSQAAFALDAGVSLSSQKRYEKGEREPDTAYLSAISRAGVDIGFVLTGNRADDKDARIKGYIHVVNFLQGYLGLGKGQLEIQFNEAVVASLDGNNLFWKNPDKNLDVSDTADDKLRAVLQRSPVLILNRLELEDLIERIEFVQEAKDIKLSPREKACLTLSLYREEREGGKRFDYTRLEQAVERGGL